MRGEVSSSCDLIVRVVRVLRLCSPEGALAATSFRQYVDPEVVKAMPNGEGDEVSIGFFKPEKWEYDNSGYMIDDDLEKAFDRRGLKPVDPFALAAFNLEDPTFATERPHGTHWKDSSGRWCHAAFNFWIDARSVHVSSSSVNKRWLNTWWFAGVRK